MVSPSQDLIDQDQLNDAIDVPMSENILSK